FLIAFSMLSFGMLAAFAARMTVRRRGFPSESPPPTRVATVISLISLVNTRPRLASAAPFLCLIVCHFECPDMEPLYREKCVKDIVSRGRPKSEEARGIIPRASDFIPAMSYSSTPLPAQYHRRWRA